MVGGDVRLGNFRVVRFGVRIGGKMEGPSSRRSNSVRVASVADLRPNPAPSGIFLRRPAMSIFGLFLESDARIPRFARGHDIRPVLSHLREGIPSCVRPSCGIIGDSPRTEWQNAVPSNGSAPSSLPGPKSCLLLLLGDFGWEVFVMGSTAEQCSDWVRRPLGTRRRRTSGTLG